MVVTMRQLLIAHSFALPCSGPAPNGTLPRPAPYTMDEFRCLQQENHTQTLSSFQDASSQPRGMFGKLLARFLGLGSTTQIQQTTALCTGQVSSTTVKYGRSLKPRGYGEWGTAHGIVVDEVLSSNASQSPATQADMKVSQRVSLPGPPPAQVDIDGKTTLTVTPIPYYYWMNYYM